MDMHISMKNYLLHSERSSQVSFSNQHKDISFLNSICELACNSFTKVADKLGRQKEKQLTLMFTRLTIDKDHRFQ